MFFLPNQQLRVVKANLKDILLSSTPHVLILRTTNIEPLTVVSKTSISINLAYKLFSVGYREANS